MKRREALKVLSALTGTAMAPRLLTGCSGDPMDNPRVAEGLTTLVTVCMENRSYDHYLGARSLIEGKGGDGLRADMMNRDGHGAGIRVFPTGAACVADPPHGWGSSHDQWNGGKNDGFVLAYQAARGMQVGPEVMGYMTRAQLPVHYTLADSGVVCDRWFCSLMGPTWPNRMYLHSAQSGGLSENRLPGPGGFPWRSIYHSLNDAGVPWAYYFSTIPFVPLFAGLPTEGRVRRVENDFFDDAAAGTLPPVVFIDPAFYVNDDHPPTAPILGQQFLAAIYNALAASPQWPNILLCITYDEHGGFFDHVAPPKAADSRAADGFDQLGFRVPTVLCGPYVKPGYVSSVTYDHTSVLKHIEKMHGLSPLTERDAAAADLSDVIDQGRLARREPLPPARLPEVVIDPVILEGECQRLRARSEFDDLADSGFFAPPHDLRQRTPQLLRALDRWARRPAT